MSQETDHGKIIFRAAKTALGPLGCKRVGRSRLWIADERWWLIVVEFQPSKLGKGSYLNVAPMWLWYEKSHFSFDFGRVRIANFVAFSGNEDFQNQIEELAALAAQEVGAFRERFRKSDRLADFVVEAERKPNSIWQDYHAAVACGLAGDTSTSQRLFERVIQSDHRANWVTVLRDRCTDLIKEASDHAKFRQEVSTIISRSRMLHRLVVDPNPLAEW